MLVTPETGKTYLVVMRPPYREAFGEGELYKVRVVGVDRVIGPTIIWVRGVMRHSKRTFNLDIWDFWPEL